MKTAVRRPPSRQGRTDSSSLGRALDDAGRPLPEVIRTRLEIEFAADFSRVRIHTDSRAAEAAAELDAEAITFGQHILFAAGAWRPETRSGWDLLIHEAAHTIQQSLVPTFNQARISDPDERLEREADQAVEQSSRGERIISPSLSSDVVIARRLAGIEPRRDAPVDPARIVEETARSLMRAIRTDGRDRDGRVRQQLIRMQDRLKRDVLRWLERNLQSQEWRQLVEVLAEPLPPGVEGLEDRESAAATTETPLTDETSSEEEETNAHAATVAPEETDAAAMVEGEREEDAAQVTGETTGGLQGEEAVETEGEIAHPEVRGGEATEEGITPAEAAVAPVAGEEAAPAVPQAAMAAPPTEEGAVATAPAAEPAISEQEELEPSGAGPASEDVQDSVGAAPGETVTAAPMVDGEATPAVPESATVESPTEDGEVTAGPVAGPAVEEQEQGPSAANPSIEDVREQGDATPGETATAARDAEAADGDGTPSSIEMPEPAQASTGLSEAREPEAAMASTAVAQREPPELAAAAPPVSAMATPADSLSLTVPSMSPSVSLRTADPVSALEAPAPVEELEPMAPAPAEEPVGSVAGGETTASGSPPVGEFTGEPPAEADGGCSGGGGGGGGGTASAQAATAEAPPEVPQDNPVDAMQSVSTMDAGQAAESIGGASEAVCGQAAAQQEQLAAEPPSVERPSGSPVDEEGTEPGAVDFSPAGPDLEPMAEAPEPVESSTPEPLEAPNPGAPVTQSLAAPRVTGSGDSELTEADAARVQQAVRDVPVTDEALNVTAGPAPAMTLEGDADPVYAEQQQTELMESAASAQQQGAEDVAAPMGEGQIYPSTEPGTLTAEPAGGGCGGGACNGGQGGEAPDQATAAVAEEERGDQIRQAAASAAGDLASRQQEQADEEQEANGQTQQDIQTAIDENANQQSEERRRARQEVNDSRQEWADEQHSAVSTAQTESNTAVGDARRDVQSRRVTAEREAGQHIQNGNREIGEVRRNAESDARAERADAQREADNSILGWLSSAITSFFNRLRESIHAVFDAARRLVREAIEAAQRLAHEVIDAARQAMVALIQAAGNLLMAIGDRLLAAFPTLRERFRNAIESVVNAAVEAVNRLAELLEEGINALLNALGAALEAILCAFERVYMAIVDAVASAVQGAISFARTMITGFGAFAELVGDIAEDPGQWVSNLGASVTDGVRNHLWCALKTAVRNWFNQTVEGIVGMGRMLLDVLRRGGLTIAKIGGFVWNAILSALPSIIVGFLIQRLVALLIPGAGAIIAVIQALIAAWGTVQQIVQAFQMFFTFLRAVKNGGAGPQFAAAVAASAVVVIQFMAMFLLSRIARAAGSVIGRLRAVAQRLMAFFRRAAGAVRRGMRTVGRAVRRGMRAMGRAMRRVGLALRRRLGRTRLGRRFLGGLRRVRRRMRNMRDRWRRWRERRRRDRERRRQQDLVRAQRDLPPMISSLLSRRPSRIRVGAQLLLWRVRYRLRRLYRGSGASSYPIIAQNSPPVVLISGYEYPLPEVMRAIDETTAELINRQYEFLTSAHLGETENERPIGSVTDPSSYFGNPVEQIRGLPIESGRGLLYPEISQRLEGADVAPRMLQFLRGYEIHPDLPRSQREALGTLGTLWLRFEPAHPRRRGIPTFGHRRDLAYSTMLIDLMQPGAGRNPLSASEAIAMHPASFGGAQTGARRATTAMRRPERPLGIPTGRRRGYSPAVREARQAFAERIRREKAVLEAWFAANPIQSDHRPTYEEIKAFVVQRLHRVIQPRRTLVS